MEKTRYEELVELDEDLIKCVRKGLIPIHLLDWKFIYERVMIEKKKNEGRGYVKNVAYDLDVSIRTVYSIIEFMEGY